jgi:hypothetical protein
MFGKRKSNLRIARGPMFRHGRESASADRIAYGDKHVSIFLAYARELDPSAWYTLGYQDKATEGV